MNRLDKQEYGALKYLSTLTKWDFKKWGDKPKHLEGDDGDFVQTLQDKGYTQLWGYKEFKPLTERGIEQLRILEEIHTRDKSLLVSYISLIISIIAIIISFFVLSK